MALFWLHALAVLFFVRYASANVDALTDIIYTNLTAVACTRLLNANGQVGCTTSSSGTTGILYLVSSPAEFEAFFNAPESAYIMLMSQAMFASTISVSTVATLRNTKKFKGIYVYDNASDVFTGTWSPDSVIPNQFNGIVNASSSAWNQGGNGIHWIDIGFPIFLLDPLDYAKVMQCYQANNLIINGVDPSYPLCGVQLTYFMWAAKDAETCLRRGYCNILGGQSSAAFIRPLSSTEKVVMLTAQIDSLDMFHTKVQGAKDVSGAVALLAAASILGDPLNIFTRTLTRNILLTLFNGEAFGYIGSSRIAVDMAANIFPSSKNFVNFSRVSSYLEVSQVTDSSLFLHVPLSTPNTAAIVNAVQTATNTSNTNLTILSNSTPPASIQSFILEQTAKNIMFPGAVLAGFNGTTFANKQYHSRFDNANSISFNGSINAAVVDNICKHAYTIALTAVSLASDTATPALQLPVNNPCNVQVTELLKCILLNQGNCSLSSMYSPSSNGGPMNLYVSVYADNSVTDGVKFFQRALADAVALNRNLTNNTENCSSFSNNVPGTSGDLTLVGGRCIRTTAFYYNAYSPAFSDTTTLSGTRKQEYSTWTESQWDVTSLRMFKIASPKSQATAIGVGCMYFVIIVLSGWFFMKYTEQQLPAASSSQDNLQSGGD